MSEELSPETKLYVKEETEKVRKAVKEEVEKVKSKATKTFSTVVIVVGLLTGLGVYGVARDYMKTAINEGLTEQGIQKLKSDAEGYVEDINGYVTDAIILGERVTSLLEDYETRMQISLTDANNHVAELSDLKTKLAEHQIAEPNGYAWIGDIKLVWGMRRSTRSGKQEFKFDPENDYSSEYNFKECFTVITSLGGRVEKNPKSFSLDRHNDYTDEKLFISFVAIGN